MARTARQKAAEGSCTEGSTPQAGAVGEVVEATPGEPGDRIDIRALDGGNHGSTAKAVATMRRRDGLTIAATVVAGHQCRSSSADSCRTAQPMPRTATSDRERHPVAGRRGELGPETTDTERRRGGRHRERPPAPRKDRGRADGGGRAQDRRGRPVCRGVARARPHLCRRRTCARASRGVSSECRGGPLASGRSAPPLRTRRAARPGRRPRRPAAGRRTHRHPAQHLDPSDQAGARAARPPASPGWTRAPRAAEVEGAGSGVVALEPAGSLRPGDPSTSGPTRATWGSASWRASPSSSSDVTTTSESTKATYGVRTRVQSEVASARRTDVVVEWDQGRPVRRHHRCDGGPVSRGVVDDEASEWARERPGSGRAARGGRARG